MQGRPLSISMTTFSWCSWLYCVGEKGRNIGTVQQSVIEIFRVLRRSTSCKMRGMWEYIVVEWKMFSKNKIFSMLTYIFPTASSNWFLTRNLEHFDKWSEILYFSKVDHFNWYSDNVTHLRGVFQVCRNSFDVFNTSIINSYSWKQKPWWYLNEKFDFLNNHNVKTHYTQHV